MTKSKNIGTVAETKVVNWLKSYGFERADRIVLKGNLDESDISIDPEIPGIIELKWRSPGAKTKDPVTGRKPAGAQNFTAGQLEGWLAEAYREGVNRGGSWCALMVNRFGKGSPLDWHVYIPAQYSTGSIKYPVGDVMLQLPRIKGCYLAMTGAQFIAWLTEEYEELLS